MRRVAPAWRAGRQRPACRAVSPPASLRALLLRQRRRAPLKLVDSIAAMPALQQAWRKVRSNGGGAGGDGVALVSFEAALDARLATLSASLTDGSYRPGPLRRVSMRKPDGRARLLSIPCIRDRVAQTSAITALQARLDARQSPASFAYRPALGVLDALAAVRAAQAAGFAWTWEADIREFFDSVPHRRLLAELAIWIEADDMLRLIGMWLDGFSPRGAGIAQGAPISPLLANLYLHPLDRMLVAAGHKPVRYADDFVVLARTRRDAAAAWQMAGRLLADRGLALHPAKTRIVPPDEAFVFLGVTIGKRGQAA